MFDKPLNLIIVGVGGQGILLASRVLGRLALDAQKDVKVSEVHGMSQRGGDVITHVRIGESVMSPLIEEGTADAVIAFEQMEAVRALPFLMPFGTLVVNTRQIAPMPVLTGAAEYPANLPQTLRAAGNLLTFDALRVARESGAPRSVNIVLLGAFARLCVPEQGPWLGAVEACVPHATIEMNRRAFLAGWEAADNDANNA